MRQTTASPSLPLLAGGLLAALAPAFVLGYSRPDPYEVEIVRWMGAAAMALAAIRPWALRAGADPARRMRRWNTVTLALAAGYLVTANPLFLVLAFATLVAAVLDAGVERASSASMDLLRRLQQDADNA